MPTKHYHKDIEIRRFAFGGPRVKNVHTYLTWDYMAESPIILVPLLLSFNFGNFASFLLLFVAFLAIFWVPSYLRVFLLISWSPI